MSSFNIRCDWEEDPGVSDPALARSWALIKICVDGEPITQFHSLRSNSVRDGVYGSAFPLAAWIVENWWFLLNEGTRALSVLRGGRETLRHDPLRRGWLQRHNLLTAREGYALPDLSLFRDEDRIHVCWAADPDDDFPRRGRFLSAGWRRIDIGCTRVGLREFVESVLERVDGVQSEDVDELRARWSIVLVSDSDPDEALAASRLAALGVHPWSPEAEALDVSVLSSLPEAVAHDLLDVTTPEHLREDLDATLAMLRLDRPSGTEGRGTWTRPPEGADLTQRQAYEAGFLRARQVRARLAVGPVAPVEDLAGRIHRFFGTFEQRTIPLATSERRIDGLVAHESSNEVRWLIGAPRSEAASRFRLARALYQWVYSPARFRLLTRSSSGWEQRASRAFAAELLAPAAGISAEIERSRDDGVIGQLARTFNVDDTVIAHQIGNHGISLAA